MSRKRKTAHGQRPRCPVCNAVIASHIGNTRRCIKGHTSGGTQWEPDLRAMDNRETRRL